MKTIDGILGSSTTAKEKEVALVSLIEEESGQVAPLVERFSSVSSSDQGTILAALESISRQRPAVVVPHVGFIIDHLDDAPPRVRWEASRVVGNLAGANAPGLRSAVPALLRNARNEGTVVRWSAAFALTQLALCDAVLGQELLPRLRELAHRETGGGIRAMYEKALKRLVPTPPAARRPRRPPP
jgi:hypothetical protein